MVLEDVGGARIAAHSDGAAVRPPRGVRAPHPPGAAPGLRASRPPSAPTVGLETQPLFLVPLATPDVHVGTLVLADPDGESADDRLMESYASRAAAAWVHAARQGRSQP